LRWLQLVLLPGIELADYYESKGDQKKADHYRRKGNKSKLRIPAFRFAAPRRVSCSTPCGITDCCGRPGQ
jgi:hypothetical protein